MVLQARFGNEKVIQALLNTCHACDGGSVKTTLFVN